MDLRKIDALIYVHVFGNDFVTVEDAVETVGVPRYSADIAAAWSVLEEMKHWHPQFYYCDTTMVWSLEWTKPRADLPEGGKWPVFRVDEPGFDQLPLVICVAALKARGVDVDSP